MGFLDQIKKTTPSDGPKPSITSSGGFLSNISTSPQNTQPESPQTPTQAIPGGVSLQNPSFGMAKTTQVVPTEKTPNITPLSVTKGIVQPIARSVGTVGVTAGNLPFEITGQKGPFESNIPTDQSKITRAVFGGEPIKTVQLRMEETKKALEPYVGKTGAGLFQAVPVVSSIALDLSGWGGRKAVTNFVEGEIPEGFFKYLAKEKSAIKIEKTLTDIGFGQYAKPLSEQWAKTKTSQQAKEVLSAFDDVMKAPKITTSEANIASDIADLPISIEQKNALQAIREGVTSAEVINVVKTIDPKVFDEAVKPTGGFLDQVQKSKETLPTVKQPENMATTPGNVPETKIPVTYKNANDFIIKKGIDPNSVNIIDNDKMLVETESFKEGLLTEVPISDFEKPEFITLNQKKYKPGRAIKDPIEVTFKDGKYHITDGANRFTQAVANGDSTIPVILTNYKESPIVKPISKSLSLETEAKKYKSAEEFVNKQLKAYHGGNIDDIENFNPNFKVGDSRNDPLSNMGINLGDKNTAQFFADSKSGKVVETILNPKKIKKTTYNNLLHEVADLMEEESGVSFGSQMRRLKTTAEKNEFLIDNLSDPEIAKKVADRYRKQGYDLIQYQNTLDGGTAYIPLTKDVLKTKSQLTDIWNKTNMVEEAKILRGTKGLTAEAIQKTYPNIKLTKDVPATDVYGNKRIIPEGEKLTPYELKDGKILLQDGETYLVSKNQFQNIKGNTVGGEPKPFAPELKGLEESVRGHDYNVEIYNQYVRDLKAKYDPSGRLNMNMLYDELPKAEQEKFDIMKKAQDTSRETATKYSQYTLPGGENYREVLIKAPETLKKGEYGTDVIDKSQTFRSSHWDEPNVISHLRLNDRTYKGKKVTFMEELQSDWAKEGRSKGFSSQVKIDWKPSKNGDLNATYKGKDLTITPEGSKFYVYEKGGALGRTVNTIEEAKTYAQNYVGFGVPDNDMLKNWQTLSIKRALKDAVDNNSEYFAWINGEQTSARYNLATHVKEVDWIPAHKSFNSAVAVGKPVEKVISIKPQAGGVSIDVGIDNTGTIHKINGGRGQDWKGKTLDEVLGKGLADKIMEKESGTLSGEGLKFGGEWANNLYDKQVKNIVEALTGAKVEMLDMGLPIEKNKTSWYTTEKSGDYRGGSVAKGELTPRDIKVGELVKNSSGDYYIITDILGDGKFKAVPKRIIDAQEIKIYQLPNGNYKVRNKFAELPQEFETRESAQRAANNNIDYENQVETFDISQKTITQQGIRLTPEVKAKIRGEAPEIKTSGKMFEEKPKTSFNIQKRPILTKDIRLPKEEIAKIIFKDIDPKNIRLIFTTELIDGVAEGSFTVNKRLGDLIQLYEENGKVSLITALHETKHYFFSKLSPEVQKEAYALAKKEMGPMYETILNKRYKGVYTGPNEANRLLEEYIVDKWAKSDATKGFGYKKSVFGKIFDAMDNLLKGIVDTYKKVKSNVDQFFKERGGSKGGYINFGGEKPKKTPLGKSVGKVTIGGKEIDITKGGQMDIPVPQKVSEIEKANKEFIKTEKKAIEATLPKEEVMGIRKQENKIRDTYDQKKADDALGFILQEFEFAEAGRRIMNGSGPHAVMSTIPSTFPKWLPDDLKSKELFNKLIEKTDSFANLQYPQNLGAIKQARLVDAVFKRIDEVTGVDTSKARADIMKQYTPETKAEIKESKALGRIVEKTHREIADTVQKEKEAKARVQKMIDDMNKTQERLKKEAEARTTLQGKINMAKTEAIKSKGLFGTIKQRLFPTKSVDPVTRVILEKWTSEKELAKEAGQTEFNKVYTKGTQNFQEIQAYEAGKPTRYIREAFDSLGTEAKREGFDFQFRENYIPHVYNETREQIFEAISKSLKEKGLTELEIQEYLNGGTLPKDKSLRLKLNPNFIKDRYFPSYSVAIKYGLTPKYRTPAQHIAHYREALDTAIANRKLIERLKMEGKLLLHEDAPDTWEPVTNRFSKEGLYARPELADLLNGKFRNEENLGVRQRVAKYASNTSKFMQDMVLSAGVPFTNINYFSVGQTIRLLTTALGEASSGQFKNAQSTLKASFAFIRANSNTASAKWFYEKREYITRMALEGIEVSERTGNYRSLYTKMSDVLDGKQGFGKVKAGFKVLGMTFNKAFNEKTFSSMMSQIKVQVFADSYDNAIKSGMPEETASQFATKITRNFTGISDEMLRGRTTEDMVSALFFAPKFREGVVNIFTNAVESFLPRNLKNELYAKNRALIYGMVITYIMYNLLNKDLNDKYMWENPSGREFALRIPLKGEDVGYIEFMPSTLAFPRNIASGVIALGKGDTKTAGQKLGSVFSMPIKLLTELATNSDYFGREIYKDTDTGLQKLKKGAIYMGLSVNHPFFKETYKYWNGDQPLYQSLSYIFELPFKYSNLTKEQKTAYYSMLDRQKVERARAKEKITPIYEKNQKLKAEGKIDEANEIYNNLSKEDKKIYDSIKKSEKTKATNARKPALQALYDENQDLIANGQRDIANMNYNALSTEDKRIYQLIKKANQNTD